MRMITGHTWGADRQSLINIYKALIRANIDQVCRWHISGRSHQQQRWNALQRGSGTAGWMVWCKQPVPQCKTKEVVMDFRQNSGDHPPLTIDSSAVERVRSTKFLGVHIKEDLTWTTNTTSLSKKVQQRLHFLHRLKRASLPPPILTTFYKGAIASVLTSCITVWYGNCSAADRKTLQRTVNTSAKIIGAPRPSILDIFLAWCSSKANSIVKDPTHPSHSLIQLLPSGRRFWSIGSGAPPDCSTASPPGCESPELNSSLNPHTNPLPPETWTITPPTPNLTHHCLRLYLCNSRCYTQARGPVQTTCSNTLSSIHTWHFSHITVCT